MWKPSKKPVMLILVFLLAWNVTSLVLTVSTQVGYTVAGMAVYNTEQDNLCVFQTENLITWWIAEMDKVDNNPRMIAVVSVFRPQHTSYVSGKIGKVWTLGANEIQLYEVTLERTGDDVKVAETGAKLSTVIDRYNLLNNFVLPWWLEKSSFYFNNYGTFENVIIGFGSEDNRIWENLDFVLISHDMVPFRLQLSPWGAIHLLIVVGALIHVWKRWG